MTDTLGQGSRVNSAPAKRTNRSSSKRQTVNTSLSLEERRMLVSDRPITFEQWVDIGGKDLYELVNGSLVEMMAAQLDHERLFAWLFRLLGGYVEARNLGEVLGSRTAVRITEFGGRLPDIVFVRKDRLGIIRQKGIYGEPDLIVEIRSPGDRPSDMNALETEYRMIGVPELWLIDPKRKRIRVLKRTDTGYDDQDITDGLLVSDTVNGFTLNVEWLWNENRPEVFSLIRKSLED